MKDWMIVVLPIVIGGVLFSYLEASGFNLYHYESKPQTTGTYQQINDKCFAGDYQKNARAIK